MIQALTLIAMSLQLLILAANPSIPSDMKRKASDVANFALEVGNKALKDTTAESVASPVATTSLGVAAVAPAAVVPTTTPIIVYLPAPIDPKETRMQQIRDEYTPRMESLFQENQELERLRFPTEHLEEISRLAGNQLGHGTTTPWEFPDFASTTLQKNTLLTFFKGYHPSASYAGTKAVAEFLDKEMKIREEKRENMRAEMKQRISAVQ